MRRNQFDRVTPSGMLQTRVQSEKRTVIECVRCTKYVQNGRTIPIRVRVGRQQFST